MRVAITMRRTEDPTLAWCLASDHHKCGDGH